MWALPALGRTASEPSLKQQEVICYKMRLIFSRWVMSNLLLLTSPLFYLYIIIGLALFGDEFYSHFWEGKGRTRFKGPDKFSLQTRVSRTQELQASVLFSRPLIAIWLLPVADKDIARPQISWQSTERAASGLWAPHSQTTLVLVYMRIRCVQEDSDLKWKWFYQSYFQPWCCKYWTVSKKEYRQISDR